MDCNEAFVKEMRTYGPFAKKHDTWEAVGSDQVTVKDNQIEDEKIEEEISVEENKYGGVILTVQKPMDSVYFANQLEDLISYWKQQGKKGMCIKVPLLHSNLVDSAVKVGFRYHQAEPDYLMLVYLIPDASVSIPANASHRVGNGAYVVNNKDEVLLQELGNKYRGTGVCEIPIGVLDESCSPGTTKNVCSLHPKFQSLLYSVKAATITVPRYFKNTDEHYTENTEDGHFHVPSLSEDNSTYKDFMCYIRDMLTVHSRYHAALLVICNSYLSSQIKNTTAPFENFQWDKTTYYTQPLQLSFSEAYDKFFPVIADITMFMSGWFFTLVLIWAVNTGILQTFSIFICIAAPCFYFSELARLATKTGVRCGPIKLSAFWFTVLAAVGICSTFVLTTLVISYTRWRLSNGKPRVGDVDDASLEGLAEVLQG